MIVVYMISNLVNGKVYIGSTNNINNRFSKHKSRLNNSTHHNNHLQNAWDKYGSDSFEFKTLMVCPDNERNHCEQMFMDLYNSQNRDFGYNIKDADGHSVSEETRLKLSEANKGQVPWIKGKHHSEETKHKISESNKSKHHSEETKQKMSEAKYGDNNPNWKKYARIVKGGSYKYKGKDKQQYVIKFNGEIYKTSFSINKLIKWFSKNFPNEELVIDVEN